MIITGGRRTGRSGVQHSVSGRQLIRKRGGFSDYWQRSQAAGGGAVPVIIKWSVASSSKVVTVAEEVVVTARKGEGGSAKGVGGDRIASCLGGKGSSYHTYHTQDTFPDPANQGNVLRHMML